jgi:hypothetical protein
MLEADRAYFREKGYEIEEKAEGGMICVVIKNYRLPAGYQAVVTDLLLRLPGGFPDASPDMFWCSPPVRFADGSLPPAADVTENHLGRPWQRFSRHLAAGTWRPGIDSLGTYVALIQRHLTMSVGGHG